MHLKSALPGLTYVVLLIGTLMVAWKLNACLGFRSGDVDHGRWYVLRASSGETYLERGVDPGNQFLDAESAVAMFEGLPSYVETVHGYGAAYVECGWLGNAPLSSSGWHLFSSEAQAIAFLRASGVAEDRIAFHYK